MVFSWFHHENHLVTHFDYHIGNQRVKIHKYTKFEENRRIQLFGTLSTRQFISWQYTYFQLINCLVNMNFCLEFSSTIIKNTVFQSFIIIEVQISRIKFYILLFLGTLKFFLVYWGIFTTY